MGYEVILIETVGVGQDELDIVDLAHTTVVMSIPGMGDDVQAMKAGILEIADIHVINKADLPGVDDVERQLNSMLENSKRHHGAWVPQIIRSVAARGEGMDLVLQSIDCHREFLEETRALSEIMEDRAHHFFLEILREGASETILRAAERDPDIQRVIEDLRRRKLDPFSAAEAVLERFRCGT